MINGKKLVIVLPAYNASQTLEKTYQEIPHQIVDEVVLVDDASKLAGAIAGVKAVENQMVVVRGPRVLI